MNSNKTYFQQISLQMENLLKNYKNQYPRNLGALVRNGFPLMMLVVAAIVLPITTAFYTATSGDFMLFIAMIFIIPVLFVFSIVLMGVNKKEKVIDKDLTNKISAVKNSVEPYKDYSDIAKYLDGYNNQLAETEKQKKQFKAKYRTIFLVFLLLVTLYSVERFWWIKHFDSCTNHSFSGTTEILGLEKDVPFLTLSPLKTDICSGYKVTTDQAEIFFQDDWLVLREMDISGAKEGDVFRLIICDKAGNPTPICVKFVFKVSENKAVNSNHICSKLVGGDTDDKSYITNDFKILELARYLIANKDDLRFLVEKIR
ncbi:MAG: hypothetical protein II956_13630 [Bacteroidales bacterium]|nr:hypothetical protein [Bacteroidales bacterium]